MSILGISFAFAQTPAVPTICTPAGVPSGYKYGGGISFNPQYSCVAATATLGSVQIVNKRDPDPAVGDTLRNPVFYFNVNNTFNLSTAVGTPAYGSTPAKGAFINSSQPAGAQYILMTGNIGTQKYLTCALFEVLKTSEPVVTVNACSGISQPVTLKLENDPANVYNRYKINWNDGSPVQIFNVTATTPLPITLSHTYVGKLEDPVVQGVHVRNSAENCPSSFYKPSSNSAKQPLIHTLEGENNGKEAKLQYVNYDAGKIYDVEAKIDNGGTSTWTSVGTTLNGNFTATGLDENLRYCFRIKFKNSCNTDVYSMNNICSISLKAKLNSTKEVELRWNMPTEPTVAPNQLRLSKDKLGCGTCAGNIPLGSNTQISHIDNTINCGDKYFYRVSTRHAGFTIGTTVWPINIKSPQITVDPKSNAVSVKPNNIVQVGYDAIDEKLIKIIISATGTSSGGDKYTFYRAENSSQDFVQIGKSDFNTFDDVSVNGGATSYCYKYKVLDACGIESDFSDKFCTIALTSKSSGMLNWTSYLVPPDIYTSATPVEYRVEYFDNTFNAFIQRSPTKNLYEDIQDLISKSKDPEIRFRIIGFQNITTAAFPNQFIYSLSNTYIIQIPPGIYIPTAFSPDGQGPVESESLNILSKFVETGNIKIYDRWGGLVFLSDDLSKPWNGTEKNGITPAPPGNYAYIVNAISATGQSFQITSSVLLLR